jgi:hypothetical protein
MVDPFYIVLFGCLLCGFGLKAIEMWLSRAGIALRYRHNTYDQDCKYYEGHNHVPATIDIHTERCVVCDPYTDREADAILGYESEPVPALQTFNEIRQENKKNKYLGWTSDINSVSVWGNDGNLYTLHDGKPVMAVCREGTKPKAMTYIQSIQTPQYDLVRY